MKKTELIFEQGGLRIEVYRTESTALVLWTGVSDSRNPAAFLNGVVLRLVEELEGCKVTVDFRRLEFMNSSTVPPIINLIKRLNSRGISTLILFADNDWQRTQLRCMQTITRTLEHVQVEGRSGNTLHPLPSSVSGEQRR